MYRGALAGLLVVAALFALPVAGAAKPDRVVIHGVDPDVIPAGLGCPFDVLWEVAGTPRFRITTSFSDGREMTVGHGSVVLTNLETRIRYVHDSRYQYTDVYDEASNAIVEQGNGRIVFTFWPGDQGLFGEVGADGAMYALHGNWRYTWDLDTDVLTAFKFSGTATDLCAILAE